MTKFRSARRLLFGVTSGLTLCGMSAMFSAQPGWGAEKITLKYGPFYRSLAVEDLVQYSDTGKATPELGSFLDLIKDKDKEPLTKALKMKFPFNVVAVDKLLKTPTADALLQEIASATILPGKNTELIAMRGALLIAASSPKGLSTTNLLESYPTPTLTVDLKRLLDLMKNGKSFKNLGGMMGSFMK